MSIQELNLETWQVALIGVAVIWEFLWKGFALWRASRNNQQGWFIALFILNTVGVLPIIYLLTNKTHVSAG
jgi:hypothetical protein